MAEAKPVVLTPKAVPIDSALSSVSRKEQRLLETIAELGAAAFTQDPQKVLERRWPIGEVATLVGRSRQMIRYREAEGFLPGPANTDDQRTGYTLQQINQMRDFFKTRPWRAESDEPLVLSFSTLKRDLAKTTLSVHLAQYLAIRGYRILFIDADPGANASSLFGLNTDLELLQWHHEAASAGGDRLPLNYTLDEYLNRDFREFANTIRASYFPGIDLVPGSMALASVEFELASIVRSDPDRLNDLRDGIRSVQDNYDVVIIDPSPSIGPLSRYAQRAASALAIPIQPTPGYVASTARFLSVLRSNLASDSSDRSVARYEFEALVVNNLDKNKAHHLEIAKTLSTKLAIEDLITATMAETSEIDAALKESRTLYDRTTTNRANDPTAIAARYLDRVNEEIETRIRRTWPSHHDRLLNEGRL